MSIRLANVSRLSGARTNAVSLCPRSIAWVTISRPTPPVAPSISSFKVSPHPPRPDRPIACDSIISVDGRHKMPLAMSCTLEVTMDNSSEQTAALAGFDQYRGLLFSIAYRMLGSVADAEDMLQETFLRWQQASAAEIRSPRAFLVTVISRLCINQ